MMQAILKKIQEVIDQGADSVRFFPLCQACFDKVLVTGVGTEEPWDEPEVYIA